MSYSINPHAASARGKAMRMLVLEHQPIQVVANRFGVHRSTIWRWYRKWKQQNRFVSLQNSIRHKDAPTSNFRLSAVHWNIPTITSAPHTHPTRIEHATVKRIIELRKAHNRCAEVIWYQLQQEGFTISLSSVKRTLDRQKLTRHWSKWKKRRTNTPRPKASAPGELVEVDTVHYVDQVTGKTAYITTVIDIYSRMAYARPSYKLLPGEALKAVILAEEEFGYKFQTVQSDNGPEFSSHFTTELSKRNICHRHTRVHKPNDNAHIERFNRTLREECIGYHKSRNLTLTLLTAKLKRYLDYYNHSRLHLGLQCNTPIRMLQR